MPLVLSRAVARRFLVLRHLLAPPRGLPPEPESVLAVVERIGSLQFDPLEVAGRNHDLVLHARVAGYRRAWTDAFLYERRVLFEAWNKGLSILPLHELPWYRITWDRDGAWHAERTFRERAETVEHVLALIRERGPLSSLDFERRQAIDWYWGPTGEVRAVLEALAEAGVLGLARREGNRRYYDLAERLFPADLLAARVEARDALRHKLLSRYRAVGLLGASGSGELWSGIRPEAGSDGPTRAQLLAELVERGDLEPVEVEGFRAPRYLVTAELPLLAQAERELADPAAVGRPGGSAPGVAFLAPLDAFCWDRDLLRRLFDFDYVWEVYTPERKRRWAYYVLPVLFGDRLVGRLEPRLDRGNVERGEGRVGGRRRRSAGPVLEIRNAWWEDGFAPDAPGFSPAFAEALDAYRAFLGATSIRWSRRASVQALRRPTGLLHRR